MTTLAEVRRLTKPLRAVRSDLSLVRRSIMMTPVRHLLRGLFFDATSSREEAHVHWFVMPLVVPARSLDLRLGNLLRRKSGNRIWRLDDPALANELVEVFASVVDPMLGPLATFEDFISFSEPRPYFIGNRIEYESPYQAAIEASRGNLAVATAAIERMALNERLSLGGPSQLYQLMSNDLLPFLRADDRDAISKLLHDWEATSARNLGVEPLYQPKPFAIDMI